jgi:hypothetical protein
MRIGPSRLSARLSRARGLELTGDLDMNDQMPSNDGASL